MSISELKKDAKIKLSGSYGKAILTFLIYIILTFLLQTILAFIKNDILKFIYSIFLLIIELPLSFGITACMIKFSRNEEVSPFDFINLGLQNISKVWRVYGRTLLKLLLPIFLVIATSIILVVCTVANVVNSQDLSAYILIDLVVLVGSIIYLIVKSLYYTLTTYVLYDNPNLTGLEIVNKSAELMQNNRMNYVTLCISFIGWYFLIAVISVLLENFFSFYASIVVTIGSLLLSPYISVSVVNFYEFLADIDTKPKENIFEKE